MGTWGPGSFDNDAALDFAAGVSGVKDIERALAVAEPGQSLDADDACALVAAADSVAAMLGRPAADCPDDLLARLKPLGAPSPDLVELARNGVSNVLTGSELTELWGEADDPAPFNLAMTDLIDRLNPDINPKKAERKPKKPASNITPCAFCDQPAGEQEFGMFDISVDLGSGEPMRLGKWAHVTCLNAHLHPKHLIQVWKFDPDEIESEVRKLLGKD